MRLGISTYSYTWAIGVPGNIHNEPLSALGLLDKAAQLGINLVQFADNLPLEKLSDGELNQIRVYAASRDISIEMGGKGLTVENTLLCLRTAAALSSPILRMVIDNPGYEPDVDTVIQHIKGLEPEFASRNIKLAIENHDRLKAREFEYIIRSVGSPYVGICLDSVNSMGAGEGFENVSEILLPYTFNLHLKDFTIHRVSHKMGFAIEGTPAGKGMLNIPSLIETLKKQGKCQSIILELWTPFHEDLSQTVQLEEQWVKESIAYLNPIFKNN